jgi:Arc/MetJ-type ribon-helix-helix transcriptional regulator
MEERLEARSVSPSRRGRPLNVWVSDDHKEHLDELAEKTRVSRSELVRQALDLLFDRAAAGQLRIGFPTRPGA